MIDKMIDRVCQTLLIFVVMLLVMHGARAQIENDCTIIPLNTDWVVLREPLGVTPSEVKTLDFTGAIPTTLPVSWDANVITSPPDDIVWYRRSVVLPKTLSQAGAFLVLESPQGALDIYWDDVRLAQLTGNGVNRRILLTGDPETTHQLVIRVARFKQAMALDRTNPGIANAALELLPATYVTEFQSSYLATSNKFSMQYRIHSTVATRVSVQFKLLTLDGKNSFAQTKPITLELTPVDNVGKPVLLTAQKLASWSPASPRRYLLRMTLSAQGKVIDMAQVICGKCAVTVNRNSGILVNNVPVLLRGLRLAGSVSLITQKTLPDTIKSELRLAQQARFNAIMSDASVFSEQVLAVADSLGLLMIADIPAQPAPATEPYPAEELQSMVAESGHHPSLLAWRIAAEPVLSPTLTLLRQLDPAHPVILQGATGAAICPPFSEEIFPITILDAVSAAGNIALLHQLQQAEHGTVPLLMSGTPFYDMADADIDARQQEAQFLTLLQQMIESVRRTDHPLGYFIRPLRGGSYSGLHTRDNKLTMSYFTAKAANAPLLLSLREPALAQKTAPDLLLINDTHVTGSYQLYWVEVDKTNTTFIRQKASIEVTLDGSVRQVIGLTADMNASLQGKSIQFILTKRDTITAVSRIIALPLTPASG